MALDFVQAQGRLQGDLQAFFRQVRRSKGAEVKVQVAMARVRRAIDQLEPLAADPGDRWPNLALEQRWGYLRLLSYLGTASHALKEVEARC